MLQAKQENKVVKQALKEAGISVKKIGHERNPSYQLVIELDFTAWHHLEHKRLPSFAPNTYIPGRPTCFPDCKVCTTKKELKEKVIPIVEKVTGRNEHMMKWIYIRFLWCDTSDNRKQWKYDYDF